MVRLTNLPDYALENEYSDKDLKRVKKNVDEIEKRLSVLDKDDLNTPLMNVTEEWYDDIKPLKKSMFDTIKFSKLVVSLIYVAHASNIPKIKSISDLLMQDLSNLSDLISDYHDSYTKKDVFKHYIRNIIEPYRKVCTIFVQNMLYMVENSLKNAGGDNTETHDIESMMKEYQERLMGGDSSDTGQEQKNEETSQN